jgi:hypothetical protein
MKSIIARGPSNDDSTNHKFLVKWEGISHKENTLENFENVAEHAVELLEEFNKKNPRMEKD